MTEMEKILVDFARRIRQNLVDSPPEITEMVTQNFWDLV